VFVIYSTATMMGNLTPYRSMSVNKGFYISKWSARFVAFENAFAVAKAVVQHFYPRWRPRWPPKLGDTSASAYIFVMAITWNW